MRNIFLTLIIIISSFNLHSQDRRVITTAVPFLMISADARASGLGEQGVDSGEKTISISHHL